MLRITIQDGEKNQTIKLEGKIVGTLGRGIRANLVNLSCHRSAQENCILIFGESASSMPKEETFCARSIGRRTLASWRIRL
jgi:hypothetical protein